jgi:hypothetical protein
MVQFTARLDKIDSDLWHFLFRVEKETAEQFIEGDNRRVICTINGMVRYHSALLHDGLGGYLILLNQERRNLLGLRQGDTFTVILEKDTSEYGMPMSEEFREVMNQSPEANSIFHALTPGKQRTLIHLCDNVKSSNIKIRRALVVSNHLLEQHGKIDFKLLNEEMKAANKDANRG